MRHLPSPTVTLVFLLALSVTALGQETRAFFYGEDRHEVQVSHRLIGIGFRAYHEIGPDEIQWRYPHLLDAVETRLPPHGVAVVSSAVGLSASDVVAILEGDPDVSFAHPVYHLGDPALEGSRHILTLDLCVGLSAGESVVHLASELRAQVLRNFAWPGTWLLRLPKDSPDDAVTVSNRLNRRSGITFAHPDWLRRLSERFVPNDPQFTSQWHLRNTGQSGGTPGADVKAEQAWNISTGDAGTIVCIIDSGVESTHADITQTSMGYNALCGAGPLNGDPTPTGCSSSYAGSHGTSCAGVAAADINNSTGVAGIAGNCVVMPINLLGSGLGYGTASMEAACFDYATQNGAAVISNSWGPDGVPWPLPSVVQASFVNSVSTGRGGLGCCIFWAGGNGNELISSDGYASSQYTMAVAASTNYDTRSSYSDYGPEVDFAAPSNGGSTGITTTSTNSSGSSNYTGSFGGTSSASPLAAGVGALVISVTPGLTWIQVRDILRNSAEQIDPGVSPGAGNYYNPATGHSPWYGHGRVDAFQAVLAAQNAAGGLTYSFTTTGVGDGLMHVSGATPLTELLIPVAVNPTIPVGSGPMFGLPAETIFLLTLPLGAAPFHVLSDSGGNYTFSIPPGVVPSGWVTHSRVMQWEGPPLWVTDFSGIAVTAF